LPTVIVVGAVLSGCTSLKPVSDWQSLHAGDKVEGRHVSGVKTTLLVGGIGVATYVILLKIALIALGATL
jgi:hypothetical protein